MNVLQPRNPRALARRATGAIVLLAGTVVAHGQPADGPSGSTGFFCATPCPPPGAEGFYTTNTWPDGKVYYRFDPLINSTQQQQMLEAWGAIAAVANVQFIPWSGQGNWVTVRPASGSSSSSSRIGMEPPGAGEQTLNIAAGHWTVPGFLMHETLHALGLYHEHQRPDRNTYVDVLLNIANFWIITNPPSPQTLNVHRPYDFPSLMHYRGASLSDDRTIIVREPWRRAWQWGIGTASFSQPSLSNGDRWTLKQMYPGPVVPPPKAFELLMPLNGALVGATWMPEFTWQASETAEAYRLQVDDSPAFDAPLISVDLPSTQTSYTHTAPMDPQRLYWWRVTASNAQGDAECYPLRSQTFCTRAAFPAALYVDDSAAAGGDGSSWSTALQDLGEATEIAWASDGVVAQIRVAEGVYTPDFASGDRTLSFWLSDACEVRGGYAGYGAPDPDARDIDEYETVLSADLNGDDAPGFTNIGDNSHHIVFSGFNQSTTLLEGFTIRGANSTLRPDVLAMGGGLVIDAGSPVIRRCRFVGNHADAGGGGLAIMYSGADPLIDACRFEGNRAGSSTTPGGGAMTVHQAKGRIVNSTLVGNTAVGGGAARVWAGAPSLVNCLIAGNTATAFGGGAMIATGSSQVELINCTVAGNTAPAPSGGVRVDSGSGAAFANGILWNNTPGQYSGAASITFSNVQGGAPGGNIDQEPAFIGSGPYAFAIGPGSPCIDAGSNVAVPAGITTDLAGNPRIIDDACTVPTGGVVDMGAYEYRFYPDCNLSGTLTIADFACFQSQFTAANPYADCNASGSLTVADFACFQSRFAAGCP